MQAPMYPPMAPAPAIRNRIGYASANALATSPRWILPVAVRGIADRNVDLLGALELRQTLFAERQDFRFGYRLRQDHRGRHFFTPGRVRHTETHCFGYRRMAQQDFVDFSAVRSFLRRD